MKEKNNTHDFACAPVADEPTKPRPPMLRIPGVREDVLRRAAERITSAPVAGEAQEHYDEVKATLQGAHRIMESLSAIERRVGPVGSHARGYTHKITNALRHLDMLYAAPQASEAVRNDGFSDGVITALEVMASHGDWGGTAYCELLLAAGMDAVIKRAVDQETWNSAGLDRTPIAVQRRVALSAQPGAQKSEPTSD